MYYVCGNIVKPLTEPFQVQCLENWHWHEQQRSGCWFFPDDPRMLFVTSHSLRDFPVQTVVQDIISIRWKMYGNVGANIYGLCVHLNEVDRMEWPLYGCSS